MDLYNVILEPLITEKSMKDADKGKYWFVVDSKANKKDIEKAVENIYGIKPKKVNVLNSPKKTRSVGRGRVYTKRRNRVKAIISLEKGKSLDQTKIKLKK